MNSAFKDPVVIITGSSRGIGRAIALAYARKGARLVLAARNRDALDAVSGEAKAIGVDVLAITVDVTDPVATKALVESAVERFGRVDVLVNNAGIGRVGAVNEAGFERDINATLQASLFGMLRLVQAVVPLMRAQGTGTIVNMSSVMGRKAFARFGSYAIVMHAVSALSDALRQELAGTGVHVAVIHPALTATDLLRDAPLADMPPPFRHMTPISVEKVAHAVIAAVDHRRRRVVLPWQANMLLLGEALSPRLGDAIARALAVKPIAGLLGMSRGSTYHELIARG
jgi:short-subunit dehydrogenase